MIAFWSRSEYLPAAPGYVCLLTPSRNSTVGDVARKVMGDVPISYVEGVGGTRVSEDEIVAVGKHDVRRLFFPMLYFANNNRSSHSNPDGNYYVH